MATDTSRMQAFGRSWNRIWHEDSKGAGYSDVDGAWRSLFGEDPPREEDCNASEARGAGTVAYAFGERAKVVSYEWCAIYEVASEFDGEAAEYEEAACLAARTLWAVLYAYSSSRHAAEGRRTWYSLPPALRAAWRYACLSLDETWPEALDRSLGEFLYECYADFVEKKTGEARVGGWDLLPQAQRAAWDLAAAAMEEECAKRRAPPARGAAT